MSTIEPKVLNSNMKHMMTPMCKKRYDLPSASWCRCTSHIISVDWCCRQDSRESLTKIAPAHPWTISHNMEDVAHHYYLRGRSLKPDFCIVGIIGTHPLCNWKTTYSTRNTTSHHRYFPSEIHGKCHYQQGQSEINGSGTQEYTVNHIVKHVGNDSQCKYVVQ